MNGQDASLYFIFVWRGKRGPFYFTNATSEADGIASGRTTRARFSRAIVENIRENRVVWDSDRDA